MIFLNHGSFGACPGAVLEAQQALRAEMEANPVAFLGRGLEDRLAAAREAVGAFVGAEPDDLAFVPNATAGIATALGALDIRPGDELLATDHEYNAALNALRVAASGRGARVVLARIPLPVTGPDEVVERVLAAVTPRTRLALVSHVTSPTALVFPVERIVALLEARGVAVLVDGAHAPGMVPLALEKLGASWYVANLHKWCCAPKGAAFLHARRDRQAGTRPLAVSHAANDPRPVPSMFRRSFDWTGTLDPTPYLAAPIALAEVDGMLDGGWPAVMAANRALARGSAGDPARRDWRRADRPRGRCSAPWPPWSFPRPTVRRPARRSPRIRSRPPCETGRSRSRSSPGRAIPLPARRGIDSFACPPTSTTTGRTTWPSRMRCATSGCAPRAEPVVPFQTWMPSRRTG